MSPVSHIILENLGTSKGRIYNRASAMCWRKVTLCTVDTGREQIYMPAALKRLSGLMYAIVCIYADIKILCGMLDNVTSAGVQLTKIC